LLFGEFSHRLSQELLLFIEQREWRAGNFGQYERHRSIGLLPDGILHRTGAPPGRPCQNCTSHAKRGPGAGPCGSWQVLLPAIGPRAPVAACAPDLTAPAASLD